jgi:hypothetical protein
MHTKKRALEEKEMVRRYAKSVIKSAAGNRIYAATIYDL